MTDREIRLKELSPAELRRLVVEMRSLNKDLWAAMNELAKKSPYAQRLVARIEEDHHGRLYFLERHLTTVEDERKIEKKVETMDRVVWGPLEGGTS